MNLFVFDIDGTLLDSTDVDQECYEIALQRAFQLESKDFNWENYQDVTDQGVTEDILEEHFGRKATEEELKKVETLMGDLIEEQKAINPEKFTPAKGVEDVLRELLTQDEIGFCLSTGAWEKSALVKLSALNVDLSSVPFTHAGPLRKRSDIVKASIEKSKKLHNIENFEIICALGDGLWDFKTANELDLNFIGIDLQKTNRLKTLGAKTVISSYKSLKTLIHIGLN